jgi:hypothetical protein
MRLLLILGTALLAAAVLAAAAGAAVIPIGPLPAPTPVRAWAGTAVLSVQDPATGRYRLAIQRGTGQPQPLAGIAPAAQPFDADIGPGPGGDAVIVFARCASPGHCHLSRTTLAGGAETPISGSAATAGWESAPSVWGNRLVFARHYDGVHASQRLYMRPLTAPRSVASVRLPGVPARECEEISGCRTITDGTLPELELRGRTLAVSVHYGLRTVGICGESELRLVNALRRTTRRIASAVCGLSGASFLGVSLTSTHLLYARICPGDPAGCQNHPTIVNRYGVRDRRTEQSPGAVLVTGFAALDDDEAVEVTAPQTHDGDCTNSIEGTSPACLLVRTGPLAFGPGR